MSATPHKKLPRFKEVSYNAVTREIQGKSTITRDGSSYYPFSADLDLFTIDLAMQASPEFLNNVTDILGIVDYDWSFVRDSSPHEKKALFQLAREYFRKARAMLVAVGLPPELVTDMTT